MTIQTFQATHSRLGAAQRPWLAGAAASHVGRVRAENQDAFLLESNLYRPMAMAAVADGMGGHRGGQVASRTVVDCLSRAFRGRVPEPGRKSYEWLGAAFNRAHLDVAERSDTEPELEGLGTTLVAALIDPAGRCTHLYCGDSRLLLFRAGRLVYQTRDQSERGQLTSCLGQGRRPMLEPAWRRNRPDGEQACLLQLGMDDVVLLCSDGLLADVETARLGRLIETFGYNPEELCRRCLEAALAGGGRDNATLVVLRRVGL